MKAVLAALSLVLISAEAHAISRYNSQSMSCAEARAVVREEGAAILRWRSARNPTLPLYGRFVRDDSYCSSMERSRTSFVPTLDRPSCAVYECKPSYPEDENFLPFRN